MKCKSESQDTNHFTPSRIKHNKAKKKKREKCVGKDVKKLKSLCITKEMQNGIGATAESNSTVPQKVQHRINMWSRNPLPICVSIPEDG